MSLPPDGLPPTPATDTKREGFRPPRAEKRGNRFWVHQVGFTTLEMTDGWTGFLVDPNLSALSLRRFNESVRQARPSLACGLPGGSAVVDSEPMWGGRAGSPAGN
jgi:hypothetical protein